MKSLEAMKDRLKWALPPIGSPNYVNRLGFLYEDMEKLIQAVEVMRRALIFYQSESPEIIQTIEDMRANGYNKAKQMLAEADAILES